MYGAMDLKTEGPCVTKSWPEEGATGILSKLAAASWLQKNATDSVNFHFVYSAVNNKCAFCTS